MGELDRGQYDRDGEVDYVNGALMLIRREAMPRRRPLGSRLPRLGRGRRLVRAHEARRFPLLVRPPRAALAHGLADHRRLHRRPDLPHRPLDGDLRAQVRRTRRAGRASSSGSPWRFRPPSCASCRAATRPRSRRSSAACSPGCACRCRRRRRPESRGRSPALGPGLPGRAPGALYSPVRKDSRRTRPCPSKEPPAGSLPGPAEKAATVRCARRSSAARRRRASAGRRPAIAKPERGRPGRTTSRRSPARRCRSSSPPTRSLDRPDRRHRRAGRVPVRPRHPSDRLPRQALDDAPVRRLRLGGRHQRALQVPARRRGRPGSRSLSTCRRSTATTPTTRWRPARSASAASRSTRSPTWSRCSTASRSARSPPR